MKIIDKNQDCYDYISNLYGIDNKIVYDRRGSFVFKSFNDVLEYLIDNTRKSDYFFILEIGYFQYLFLIEDAIKEYNHKTFKTTYSFKKLSLFKVFNDNKHYFEKPITLCKARIQPNWFFKKGEKYTITSFKESIRYEKEKAVSNPILKDIEITKFIEPKEIWSHVCNYISSLENDKNVEIKNTDVDKAINHGFDKRWSFRHPIK